MSDMEKLECKDFLCMFIKVRSCTLFNLWDGFSIKVKSGACWNGTIVCDLSFCSCDKTVTIENWSMETCVLLTESVSTVR